MKFLCDNCKAKYQIADEKVAGKTVRMKCRKCGHQIEVRAAVTETSVSTAPPKPNQPPPAPRVGSKPGLATSLSATKPRSPSNSGAPARDGGSSSLANAFMSNVQEAPSSVPGGGSAGSLTRGTPIELSVSDEWYVAINGVPVGPVRISELRRKAAGGAVTEDSLCWQEGLEEWRPIKSIPDLAALVREAALGNRPSLIGDAPPPQPPVPPPPPPPVATRSPSLPSAPRQPVSPPAARNTPPPPRPMTGGDFRPLTPSAPSFGPGPTPAQRSNVVPLRPAASGGLGVSALDDLSSSVGRSNQSYPDAGGAAPAFSLTPAPSPLFTPPQPTSTSSPMSTPMVPAASPAVDPFALPPMVGPPTPAPPLAQLGAPLAPSMTPTPYPDPVAARPPARERGARTELGVWGEAPRESMAPPPAYMEPQRKAGVPLWFWPILVLALGFGGGVAFLVFRPQPAPQPVVIQMPATATAQPTENKDNTNIPPPSSAEPATADSSAPNKPGTKTGPIAKAGAAKPGPTEEKKGLDLGNLVPGGGGPNVGPGSGPGAAGGGLDQAAVERVVAGHRQGVRRTCWERGGPDQKSSVNVMVTANVAPNGSVSSTSSTGDDPVVAKCIENQVKTWSFPAPGSPTTLNIPFKFVRQ